MQFSMKNVTKEEMEERRNSRDYVGYFSLKDDGDKARVRFLFTGIDDVVGHYVHKLTFANGKFRFVECLKNDYNDPEGICPICDAQTKESKILQKMWLPLWDIDQKKYLFWDRGPLFWTDTLLPLMQELCQGGTPFCAHTFEVTRYGQAGDQETAYDVVDLGADSTTINDFFDIPDPVEIIKLNRSFEELYNYVKTGNLELPSVADRHTTSTQAQAGEAPTFPTRRRGTGSPIPPRRGTRPNLV